MNNYLRTKKSNLLCRIVSVFIAITFVFSSSVPPSYAQGTVHLPTPGTMIPLSIPFAPAMVRGINLYPDNPLKFNFLIDLGDTDPSDDAFQKESMKLIKYFLAALTVPEDEMWVNLSPYEENRIIPKGFGNTEMGRDLLAQDYLLKQLTASLIYPENELGSTFWDRVYAKAQEQYGTTEIPMNTFNKVWIVPQEAKIYEHANGAFVVSSHLNVMLEEDYLALESNMGSTKHGLGNVTEDDLHVVSDVSSQIIQDLIIPATEHSTKPSRDNSVPGSVANQIIKEIIVPEIEREVNEGKTFANLRQIYNSMILAVWYKQTLQESLLGQIYANQNKTAGISLKNKQANQKIYQQYVKAFSKGVFDFIKEDYDETAQKAIPRKYFSGGAVGFRGGEKEFVPAAVTELPTEFTGRSVEFSLSAASPIPQLTQKTVTLTPDGESDVELEYLDYPIQIIIENKPTNETHVLELFIDTSGKLMLNSPRWHGGSSTREEYAIPDSYEYREVRGVSISIYREGKNIRIVRSEGDVRGDHSDTGTVRVSFHVRDESSSPEGIPQGSSPIPQLERKIVTMTPDPETERSIDVEYLGRPIQITIQNEPTHEVHVLELFIDDLSGKLMLRSPGYGTLGTNDLGPIEDYPIGNTFGYRRVRGVSISIHRDGDNIKISRSEGDVGGDHSDTGTVEVTFNKRGENFSPASIRPLSFQRDHEVERLMRNLEEVEGQRFSQRSTRAREYGSDTRVARAWRQIDQGAKEKITQLKEDFKRVRRDDDNPDRIMSDYKERLARYRDVQEKRNRQSAQELPNQLTLGEDGQSAIEIRQNNFVGFGVVYLRDADGQPVATLTFDPHNESVELLDYQYSSPQTLLSWNQDSGPGYIVRARWLEDENDGQGFGLALSLSEADGRNLKVSFDGIPQGSSPIAATGLPGAGENSAVGGIDLNSNELNLDVQTKGDGINPSFFNAPFEHINVRGFVPVITNISPPIMNYLPMLGLANEDLHQQLTRR